jgi:hypothetical protein
VEVFVSEKD